MLRWILLLPAVLAAFAACALLPIPGGTLILALCPDSMIEAQAVASSADPEAVGWLSCGSDWASLGYRLLAGFALFGSPLVAAATGYVVAPSHKRTVLAVLLVPALAFIGHFAFQIGR